VRFRDESKAVEDAFGEVLVWAVGVAWHEDVAAGLAEGEVDEEDARLAAGDDKGVVCAFEFGDARG
jgi:hypothetical protein